MTYTEQALLIILSLFLALFLILSMIALVWIIKILSQLKRIIDSTEKVIDKAENIAIFFEKTAPTVALGRLVSNITEAVFHGGDKVKKNERTRREKQ